MTIPSKPIYDASGAAQRARRREPRARGLFGRIAGGLALAMLLSLGAALAGGDWNDAQIGWQAYDAGLSAAKAGKKPICLVFYTEWCPHCSAYSAVFHDAKVVEMSKRFVMVRIDRDKSRDISKQYAPDGEYIPRTFFVSSEGKVDLNIHAPREQYKYFYDERSPDSVLAGMDAALKAFVAAPPEPPAPPPPAPPKPGK